MEKAEVMNFGKPDEVRKFPKGYLELLKIGGATVGPGDKKLKPCQNI